MIDKIRSVSRELLENGDVSYVIGYEMGTRGGTRPAIISDAQDVEKLVWNRECYANLTTFLHDYKKPSRRGEDLPRVAVMVKPCDSRTINVLLAERQIKRENVHIIGLTCGGMMAEGKLREECLRCNIRTPIVYDTLIGDPPDVDVVDDMQDVSELEAMTAEERLQFWLSELDRCIRCYACRDACPGCYCTVCEFDRDDSLWIGMQNELPEKHFFHTFRAMHLAGRCVDCNECERVCPMEIPLSLLNRKLAKEVRELYGFEGGMNTELTPFITVLADGEVSLI
ncbi:MAG: 4Fe-4S dicluster domain-containing protein [Chloroflexota bacterium]